MVLRSVVEIKVKKYSARIFSQIFWLLCLSAFKRKDFIQAKTKAEIGFLRLRCRSRVNALQMVHSLSTYANFSKTLTFLAPLIISRTCAYHAVRNISLLRKNLRTY